MRQLKEAGLKAKISKCHFWNGGIDVLGGIV